MFSMSVSKTPTRSVSLLITFVCSVSSSSWFTTWCIRLTKSSSGMRTILLLFAFGNKPRGYGYAGMLQERSERGGHYREASALDILHLLRSLSKIPKPILHSHEVSGTKLRRFL